MHETVMRLLDRPVTSLLARLLLTAPFWLSAISKSIGFDMGVAEMARAGLEPAIGFNLATIAVQLAGSLFIISGHYVWFGAGMLAIFTGLTVPLVHHFWTMTDEPFQTIAFHTAIEHVGLIGGLLGIAVLSSRNGGNLSKGRA
ncbi:DoxX family protein [Ancylobacter pratisalsi]|uniref:DoxX family protein n=1 Tax=Ancylobacter pratisalsi TaxID=1745854 RepID=A0A6P1YJ55_9HYPH|nr:DoxX family protein [Ancylobacter pratisalsi]QIB33165.1 DoxX family protein [Ancylobacter pratisalsi]